MLNKLRKFLNNYGQIRIIEAIVDPDVQVEYLEFASKTRKKFDRDKVIEESDKIFDENYDIDEKKKLLTLIAVIDDVELYRKLEKYLEIAPENIKPWVLLAHQESQTVIQSSLLDENQILISTGLGGKGDKMRFFIVLQTENKKNIVKKFQEIIKNEVLYTFEKNDCELEQINFKNYFCTMVALIPFDMEIEKVFVDVISECNNLGVNFSDKFIVTNVKIHTPEQTQDLINELEEKAKQDAENPYEEENLIFDENNLNEDEPFDDDEDYDDDAPFDDDEDFDDDEFNDFLDDDIENLFNEDNEFDEDEFKDEDEEDEEDDSY